MSTATGSAWFMHVFKYNVTEALVIDIVQIYTKNTNANDHWIHMHSKDILWANTLTT